MVSEIICYVLLFFLRCSSESVDVAIPSTLFFEYLFTCLPLPLEGALLQHGEKALFNPVSPVPDT